MDKTSEVHENQDSFNNTPHQIDLNSFPAPCYPSPKKSVENESSSNIDEASYEKPEGQNDSNASSKEQKDSEQNHDNDCSYISRASSGFDYRESPNQTPCCFDLNYVPAPDYPSPQKSSEKAGRNIVEAAYEKPEGQGNSNPSSEKHDDSEQSDDNGSYSPRSPSPGYDDPYSPRYNTFERAYNCYPLSLIEKSHLEQGNQIIMPSSAFELLLDTEVEYPMLFEIRNQLNERVSHCGVYEFTAQDGSIFLPNWMMKNLQLQDGDIVSLKNTSLEKGSFIKLQPHSTDFLNIQNPKAVLEEALSARFFCLTTDTGSVKEESHAINTDPEFSLHKRPASIAFGSLT